MGDNFGSPLRQKKVKEEKEEKWAKVIVSLPAAEAKKVLAFKGPLAKSQIQWTERWLQQLVRERSLPPQLAHSDAFGQLKIFLDGADLDAVLARVRADFLKTLSGLESEAYSAHLSRSPSGGRNTLKSVGDQLLETTPYKE